MLEQAEKRLALAELSNAALLEEVRKHERISKDRLHRMQQRWHCLLIQARSELIALREAMKRS